MAPTGAQGVTICVCLSVRYKVLSLHLSGSNVQAVSQSAVSQQSGSSQSAVSQQSVSSWQSVSSQLAVTEQSESRGIPASTIFVAVAVAVAIAVNFSTI